MRFWAEEQEEEDEDEQTHIGLEGNIEATSVDDLQFDPETLVVEKGLSGIANDRQLISHLHVSHNQLVHEVGQLKWE